MNIQIYSSVKILIFIVEYPEVSRKYIQLLNVLEYLSHTALMLQYTLMGPKLQDKMTTSSRPRQNLPEQSKVDRLLS